MAESKEHSLGQKLGEFSLKLSQFPHLQEKLDQFQTENSLKVSERVLIQKVHELLLECIQSVPAPCFLLGAVNEFILSVNTRRWLKNYSFAKFELWLNIFSGLTAQENYLVRSKIVGRFIPRDAYQSLFPVGMGKKFAGSHYVTAHSSPDLDTTVASFWGWADAFAARVSEGLHIWNVPGGPPESQVEVQLLFYQIIGPHFFDHFAKTRGSLALSAVDLLNRNGLVEKEVQDSVQSLDFGKCQKIVLVDDERNFLADWRQLDVEGVRKVTALLHSCLRWFSSYFQRRLVSLFSEAIVSQEKAQKWAQEMFALHFEEADPVKGFTEKQKKHLEDCLVKVLKIPQGWKATFDDFWVAMESLSLLEFGEFRCEVKSLSSSSLFQKDGKLIESRPEVFSHLEKVFTSLEGAIQSLRIYLDRLGVAFSIKKEVFGYPLQVVSSRAEVEEIRSKMGSLSYVTVATADSEGNLFSLGTISSSEIFKPILGTVSLRDFCNRDETKVPSYFEIISVVDHHKTSLSTLSAPTVLIADSQSANVLVAEASFALNDQYGLSGCNISEMKDRSLEVSKDLSSSDCRILQRVLQKHLTSQRNEPYFVHPQREYLEYLQYLYAILDDTDLLSKVSTRDVVCIASILNRLKTLQLQKESEVISFDDLPRGEKFASLAAKRILQNVEMYSLYKKVYSLKEEAVETSLRLCVKGEVSSVFADTKVQNGCCRVGQTKIFAKNFPFYNSHAREVRSLWYLDAKSFYEERKECDLHMHMISTVPGADDVYAGKEKNFDHQDELWIWIPMEEQAIEHLKMFLNAFRNSPQIMNNPMEVEFLGDNAQELEKIFKESFSLFTKRETEKEKKISIPVAILKYRAGLLNSRKAMVSPYLPKLMN